MKIAILSCTRNNNLKRVNFHILRKISRIEIFTFAPLLPLRIERPFLLSPGFREHRHVI